VNWRSILIIVVLAGLCIVGLRALDEVSAALNKRPPVALPQIDYTLYDVTVTRYRPDQNEVLEVNTKKAEHWRAERELRASGVNVSQKGAVDVWILVAPEARLSELDDLLRLSGGVLLRRESAGLGTRLRSPSLNVDLKQQIVSTERNVEVEDGHSILRGRGLVADLKSERFEILHDAEINYRPRPRPAVLQPKSIGAPSGQ